MLQAREITPNEGPVVVVCDNPEHPTRRFTTVGLAESFLLGNAISGDCLHQHTVMEQYAVNPDAPDEGHDLRAVAMRDLGNLLASLMPVEGDDDDCERAL